MLPREGVYERDAHKRAFERNSRDGWCGVSRRVLLYVDRHGADRVSPRIVLSGRRVAPDGMFRRIVLCGRFIVADHMPCRVLLRKGKFQNAMCHRDVFSVDRCIVSVDVSGVPCWFILSERFGVCDDVSGWQFLSIRNRCVDAMYCRVLLSDDAGPDYVSGGCDVCSWNVERL